MLTVVRKEGGAMSKEVILKTYTSGIRYYPVHIILQNAGDKDITNLVRDANDRWGYGVDSISRLPSEIKQLVKKYGGTNICISKSTDSFDKSIQSRVKMFRHGPCTLDGHVVKAVSDRIRCFTVTFSM